MLDLRLITILPPQPVQGVSQPQIAGSDAKQAGISTLQIGSILSGFIINRDASGNPILRTESGDITFASNFFLKIGSEITIRIEHTAGQNIAHILTVNGEAPEIAAAKSSFAGEPEIRVNVGGSVGVGEKNTPTANIQAVIISPASNAKGEIILPTSSVLALKVITSAPPQTATPAPQAISQASPQTTIQPNNQPPTTNAQQQPLSAPFSAYERAATATPYYSATPQANPTINAQTPTPTLAPAQPPQIGEQISAKIIRIDQNNGVVAQTPLGIVLLPQGIKLPVGSQITFEIAQIQTPETPHITEQNAAPIAAEIAAPATPLTPATLPQLARRAGALSNIFSLLAGLPNGEAADFVNNVIPNISAPSQIPTPTPPQPTKEQNIPTALLNFVVAMKNGDFREWLGRGNARWLENNGHGELLKRAEGEFMMLAQQWTNPPASQQWQSLFFPIAVDGLLQQTRLFVKRDRKQETRDGVQKTEEDTRFVLEMDLSALGQMQMDGFVRRNDANVNFDLVIRSHAALTKEIQNDILEIYNSAGEITGYKGSLNFQTVHDFPVNPMEDIMASQHQGIVA